MAIVIDYDIHGQPVEGKGLHIEVDYTGGPGDQPTFIGWAVPGLGTDEPVWKIVKLEYDGDNLVRKLWAASGEPPVPNTKFDKVWDDRAGLTYG